MLQLKSDNFNNLYRVLCCNILNYGEVVNNTVELLNCSLELTDLNNCYLTNNYRSINLKYLLAENFYYAKGDNSLSFISSFAPFWNKISDNGKTVNSAYGYIIKNKFGFNQIEKVIELLKKDKNSRRAIININDANKNIIETKDEECTINLQYLIRDNKLFAITNMRSNDMHKGIIYDVPAFIAIQQYIAYRLGIKCGSYTHNIVSAHIYLDDINTILKIIRAEDINLKYDIDLVQIYRIAEVCYSLINKDNIIDLCLKWGVLYDRKL